MVYYITQNVMTDLPRYMMPDVHLLIIEEHSIDSFNSSICSFGCLIMNIAITTSATLFVGSDLAR